MELTLEFGSGLYTLSTSALGEQGFVADSEPHLVAVDFGTLNPVLSVDGVAIKGRDYGDTVFPSKNLLVGEAKSTHYPVLMNSL